MDSSKEGGYAQVTKQMDQKFVEAQSIIEAYHPKLVLLEVLSDLQEQTERREQAAERLVRAIGRARDDIIRDVQRTSSTEAAGTSKKD